MSECKLGDTVTIHYTGKDADGSVFDSSKGRQPLRFTLGDPNLIRGFTAGVLGMSKGETKTVVVPVAEAYGPRRDELVMRVPRAQVPPEANPKVGDQVGMRAPNGQVMPVQVTEVTDEVVVLDANHPLAGKELTFELELVDMEPKDGEKAASE